ncbi:MAG: hypothetical protein HQL73_12475 [Magnetococcales bacterium]|nr:hypothetical protein [Magnetococcales bacterium]
MNFIAGAGAPGGAGGFPDAAPKGSVYADETNGQMYLKKAAGTGADKWIRMQSKDDMDMALLGLSWRQPAKVRDSSVYVDLATAQTAMNTGTIDGIPVVANDRILFEGITGAAKNVFIVTGTPGSGATLVEDSNTASKGDALYVLEGTSAGKQFVFNGTDWVMQGSASETELAFLRAFMGKPGNGNVAPEYSSTNVVTNGTDLKTAIGALDAAAGAAIADIATLDTRLDKVGMLPPVQDYIAQMDYAVANLSALAAAIHDNYKHRIDIVPLDGARLLLLGTWGGSEPGIYIYTTANGGTLTADSEIAVEGDQVFVEGVGRTYVYKVVSFALGFIPVFGWVDSSLEHVFGALLDPVVETKKKNDPNIAGVAQSLQSLFDSANNDFIAEGVVIQNGDRVLIDVGPVQFSPNNANIHGIYSYDGVGGHFVLVHTLVRGDTVYDNATGVVYRFDGEQEIHVLSSEAAMLQGFVGKSTGGYAPPSYSSAFVVTQGSPLVGAIGALDAALAAAKKEAKADNVTTVSVVDSILVDTAIAVEWTVHCRSTANPNKVHCSKILAIHDGTASADATVVDFSEFSILRTSGAIDGLVFDVDINGVGAAQVARLKVTSTDAVDVRVTRSFMNHQ